MPFDGNNLYPTLMAVYESIYFKIENGDAFSKDVNDSWVISFNNQTFTKSSATSIVNFWKPEKKFSIYPI